MRSLPYLPNLLSSLRIALAPAMLGAAYSTSKMGFGFLLGVALSTDMLDGVLARRWKAESEMGRRLDHWGDALTMSLGAAGVLLLWPENVEREWPWALIALVSYVAIGIDQLFLRPDQEKIPSWSQRILALVAPLSLVPLITEWSPWPFRAAVVLQALLGVLKLSQGRAPAQAARVGETSMGTPVASRRAHAGGD